MSAAVPAGLVQQVTAGYPDMAVYTDRAAMLAQHPPTPLDCYEPDPSPEPARQRITRRCAATVSVILGLLPSAWTTGDQVLLYLWLMALLYLACNAVMLHRRWQDTHARRQFLLFVALMLWLIAPLTAPAGVLLLRLPLFKFATDFIGQHYRMARAAATFPARI